MSTPSRPHTSPMIERDWSHHGGLCQFHIARRAGHTQSLSDRVLITLVQLIALVVMILTLLWPAPYDRTALPGAFRGSDLFISHWTNAEVIKQAVAAEGRLPLWNPVFGAGRPLAADPFAALFYPPMHLLHLLDVRDHLMVMFAGHLLWAGVGTLVLAQRALRVSPFAALIAALAFMASPRLVAHLGAGHLTMIQTASWLPWVVLAGWATVRDPLRWAVPLALCMALMVMAGHPQMAYYGGLMLAGVSLWLLALRWRKDGWRAVLLSSAGLAAAGTLAAMLAMAHLLPLAEFTAHSTRQQSVASRDAWSLWDFVTALLGFGERSSSPHEGLFEVGLGVLGLAVFGVAAYRRVALPMLLGVAIVASLALGVSSPVYRLAAAVLPAFDGFRGLARIWFVGSLGIALLAGLGAHVLLTVVWRSGRWGIRFASVIAGMLFVASLIQSSQPLTNVQEIDQHVIPSSLERVAVKHAGGGRIYGVQRNLRQEIAAQLDARLAHGWDPLLIEPYVSFMQRAGGYTFKGYQLSVPPFEVYDQANPMVQDAQPDAHLLGLLDVEVVMSYTQLDDPRLKRVSKVGDTLIYRNTANRGPAYLVAPAANNAPPTIESIQMLDANVNVLEHHAERLVVRLTAEAGGWLVIGTPAFPGWRATVDGQPVALSSLEGVVPALPIGSGTHEVIYEYAPRSLLIGAIVSVAGMLLSGAWLIGVYVMRRGGRQMNALETFS